MEYKVLLKEVVKLGMIRSIKDINELVKYIYRKPLNTMLEAELDDELDYRCHDYRNKQTKCP